MSLPAVSEIDNMTLYLYCRMWLKLNLLICQILIKLILMNSLIFNPHIKNVPEWEAVYLRQPQITQLQTIVDRTCTYLTSIRVMTQRLRPTSPTQLRRLHSKEHKIEPKGVVLPVDPTLGSCSHTDHSRSSLWAEGQVQKKLELVHEMKEKFKSDYKESLVPQIQKNQYLPTTHITEKYISPRTGKPKPLNKLQTCQAHLLDLKKFSVNLYEQCLQEETRLLSEFISHTIDKLKSKLNKISYFLQQTMTIEKQQNIAAKVRILFDNIFIELEYLRSLIEKNLTVLDEQSERDFAGDDPQMFSIRERVENILRNRLKEVQYLKQQLRILYLHHYSKKHHRLLQKNPQKVESILIKQIAVNIQQYQDISTENAWANGFITAVLIFALGAIIIFRQLKIQELQSLTDYKMQFQVWRGASYLIVFNWVLAITFFLLTRLKINYKLVLLQDNYIVGKYQSFFRTAFLLTTIYLVLFLVYLLHELKYIENKDGLSNLGYVMWIINIAFVLNPFKILNYESRMYYLYLLKKLLVSPFYPMNPKILFFTLMVGSFAQPFNDFAFTICTVQGLDLKTCQWRARLVTFIYLLVYFSLRVIQSFRLHSQFFPGVLFSKPRMRFVAAVFSIATIIASFLYTLYLTDQMLNFWIAVGSIATVARTHAEIRADWGLISLDQEDCLLRKNKRFSNIAYYLAMIATPILDVAWVLTISNNAEAVKINVLYFFLLLSCIEFIRRGMWMVYMIEDFHTVNVGNLCALASDTAIAEQLQKHFGGSQLSTESQNILREVDLHKDQILPEVACARAARDLKEIPPEVGLEIIIKSSPVTSEMVEHMPEISLQWLQERVQAKLKSGTQLKRLLEELEKHLAFVSRTYQKIHQQSI